MEKSQSSPEPPQAWLWPQPNSSSPKALTSTSPAAAKINSTTRSAKSAAMSPVYAATRVIRDCAYQRPRLASWLGNDMAHPDGCDRYGCRCGHPHRGVLPSLSQIHVPVPATHEV